MPGDQLRDLFTGVLVIPKPGQDLCCQNCTSWSMPFEMPGAVRIQGKAVRLSHIMQQHGEPQQGISGRRSHRMGNVGPHIVTVIPAVLGKAKTWGKLRNGHKHHIPVPAQNFRHMLPHQQLIQF